MWAAADAAQYECDVPAIAFRPTLMFQTRTFSFTFRNIGATVLPFRWALLADETPDTSGLYQANPPNEASQPSTL